MSLFNELVFEKKWDAQVWLLFAFASFALVIELASLGAHMYERIEGEERIIKNPESGIQNVINNEESKTADSF